MTASQWRREIEFQSHAGSIEACLGKRWTACVDGLVSIPRWFD